MSSVAWDVTGEQIAEIVAAERRACAAAMCYWCRWNPIIERSMEGLMAVEPAAKGQGNQHHPFLHVLIYKDGGRGGVRCEASPIWSLG